tara:strand:- start:427 stop:1581 length:1155 start_codon:yes stop_codon:yes gene_type:complete
MAINLADNNPRISYTVGQGATTTTFAVPFEFFASSDLKVFKDGVLQTITTHYTVSGGNGSTGSVAMSVTGGTGGTIVLITRKVPLERTTDFPASGAFDVTALNTQLDRIIAIQADLDDVQARSLVLSDGDAAVTTTLPLKAARLGKVLAFNASTGVPEAGPTIADTQTVANISADIATLADIEDGTDATNAIQTVATASSNVNTVASNISNINTVAGNNTNINTVAGANSNITTVAGINDKITTVSGISAKVTTVADNNSNVTTVANANSNITTVAGLNTEITAVAAKTTEISSVHGSITNVNTVASNISNVDSFATNYRISASAPSSSLSAGVLWYDTSVNRLKVYTGSEFINVNESEVRASAPTASDANNKPSGYVFFVTGS